MLFDIGYFDNIIYIFINRWLYSKEIYVGEVDMWCTFIVETICMIEKEMPISFMDIQVHLFIHLVDDIENAGAVNFLWRYF